MEAATSVKDLGEEKDVSINIGSHRISYGDIAEKLLTDRLLLTALELHCELTEAGKEVPKLKEYFSNPGNFETQSSRTELSPTAITRWPSQATLDSFVSEDGEKLIDDRIAVLEFELRKAKETINALRTNLTVATECENQGQDGTDSSKYTSNEPIKPYEQRTLNFLINEYLLLRGYKLTSITFADENEDQDFEVWDDVGLNIPKPPELLCLYRDFMKCSGNIQTAESCCVECQTDLFIDETAILIEECQLLRNRISELELEKESLAECLERTKKDILEPDMSHFAAPVSESSSHDHFVMVEPTSQSDNDSKNGEPSKFNDRPNELPITTSDAVDASNVDITASENVDDNEIESDNISSCSNDEWTKVNTPTNTETRSFDECVRLVIDLIQNSERNLPVAYQKELFSKCFIDPGRLIGDESNDESSDCVTLDSVVTVLANCLCSVTPYISSNKREELILLLVFTIKLHPDFKVREKLIQLLFSLKKKPHEFERKPILAGIVWLVRKCDMNFVENELFPLWWEQISQKYAERKLLICEACSSVLPYVPNTIRTSILLPILQQMLLEDREERIRISAINCIAFIVAYINDENKYSQCEELAFTGLQDHNGEVVQCTADVLLAVLGKWAFDSNRLQSHLFTRLLNLLSSQIKSAVLQQKDDSSSPFKQTLSWETRCVWTVVAIRSLLPYLVMFVASVPDVLDRIHPNLPLAAPRTQFAELCRGLYNPAIFYDGKYSIGGIMSAFDVCIDENISWPQLEWVIQCMIEKLLDCLDQIVVATQSDLLTAFISLFHSIVSGFGKMFSNSKIKPIFRERLQRIEADLPNLSTDWPSLSILPVYLVAILVPLQDIETLQDTLRRFLVALSLVGYPLNVIQFSVKILSRNNSVEESLMNALWEGVIHQRELVRSVVLKLFIEIIPNVSHFSITNRIIPALMTLSNDSDLNVKTGTIPVFGTLINQISIKQVAEKCYFQIQTFLTEPNLYDHHSMLIQLIQTFRDIASKCDATFRDDVLIQHLNTFSLYAGQLNNLSRRHDLINALLEAYAAVIYCSLSRNVVHNALLPGLKSLESVAHESSPAHYETVLSLIKDVECRYSIESPVAQLSSSFVPNVGQEVKQKMSKIFPPIAKHGMFWKK